MSGYLVYLTQPAGIGLVTGIAVCTLLAVIFRKPLKNLFSNMRTSSSSLYERMLRKTSRPTQAAVQTG